MAIMIRVAIVEDHPATAEGLAALLSAETDVQIVGTAGSVAGARDLIAATTPDVVLCDVELAGSERGFALLETTRDESVAPRAAIVFLSSYDYPAFLALAPERGASATSSRHPRSRTAATRSGRRRRAARHSLSPRSVPPRVPGAARRTASLPSSSSSPPAAPTTRSPWPSRSSPRPSRATSVGCSAATASSAGQNSRCWPCERAGSGCGLADPRRYGKRRLDAILPIGHDREGEDS